MKECFYLYVVTLLVTPSNGFNLDENNMIW